MYCKLTQIWEKLLRLGAQSVTLSSTLRDPTQLRRRQCACTRYAIFEGIDRTQKSRASKQKKFGQGLEDFVHVFGKLTSPSVMFESKKLKFLLLIRRKIQSEPKKVQLPGKKSSARVQRILPIIFAVDHSLCDV